MIPRTNCQPLEYICVLVIVSLCAFLGCSKVKAPSPAMAVSVANVTTDTNGAVLVRLGITNISKNTLLIGVRSAIYQANGSWITNYNVRPLFVGMSGPGSMASDVTLAAGHGTTAGLSPMSMSQPFQIEFVCFPSRSGVIGMVDEAKDKVSGFSDGSQHESYLGNSFYILSPVIAPPTNQTAK